MLIGKSLILIIFCMVIGISYGMGETSPMQSVPTGIVCKVVDNTGKSHILKDCNCDGRTYIDVKNGSISYFIDLANIRYIDVKTFRDNEILADLSTSNDPSGKLISISKDTICYGIGSFGNAKFYLKNIKYLYIIKP